MSEIYDYYLSKAEQYSDIELSQNKRELLDKVLVNHINKVDDFCPHQKDLTNLPQHSTLIKVNFTLKKPYTSKDDREFYIIKDGKVVENPLVRDKFTGLPIVRPSTWKGHLRFAAEYVEEDAAKRKEIIRRLFGAETNEESSLKGRLYFFPTFFKDTPKDKSEEKDKSGDESDVALDVITPLDRETKTPARGPIPLEVIKPDAKGEFYLLYMPYPRGEDFDLREIQEDLAFLAEALRLMFYTYGFSAKKTSGFGVINKLGEDDIEVYPEDRKKYFSGLYMVDISDGVCVRDEEGGGEDVLL